MTDNHYLIADLHLGHVGVIKMDNRPFGSIEEHDQHLAHQCAAAGRPKRTLWIMGDVARKVSDLEAFMHQVKPQWGRVILIRGNHDDKVAWRHRAMFDEAHEARYVRVSPDVKVYLSHYAHRVWRNSHHGSFHFHGHSHGHLPRVGRSMDVGAPCVGYKPMCMTEGVKMLGHVSFTHHHRA